MNTLVEQIIGDFQERALPRPTPREAVLPAIAGKVDSLIGVRRTGKSWRIFQAMNELLDAGTPKQCLLYVNFDDERLHPMTAGDLRLIPETFFRLYPENKTRRCHFFFDEIQNVPGWERFIRRLLDTEQAHLTLTGSSARLLSREIATTLRGRSLATEIFPFSFRETLRHQGEDDTLVEPAGSHRRALLSNRLRRYLEIGGFPEVQNVDDTYRLRILQDYVDVVILRDVVERHGIGNLAPLRYLIRHLLGSPACAFSVNRFHNDLKSQGIACGKNSLHDYLAHLEDAYLVQSVSLDSRSARQRQVNPRKVYPIDTGLAQAFRHAPGMDRGRLLETLVFLDLRRRGMSIAYFRTDKGHEVDFLARSGDDEALAIQVAETLADPATRQRELRALEACMADRRPSRGVVVTLDEEERIETAAGPVEVIPAWRWLLRG
ncbi:MAG: ATP-binding protein [Betaproteobacteria bacterium]|nr:ATP-binding protein [Betaproteobacteria bacterium]